jgi:peptidoglycan hydrolase CwlO-like protein
MTGLNQTAMAAVFSFTMVMACFSTSVFAQENSESLLTTIVPSRPMEEIHAEIDHTAISSERSKTKLNNAQATLASVEARIKTKKMEIDDLAKQAKPAKKCQPK